MTEYILAIVFLVLGTALIVFSSPMARSAYKLNFQMWKGLHTAESSSPKWQWYWKSGITLHIWINRIFGLGCLIGRRGLIPGLL
jgi:hypothetical protein